ncbi:MAG TPA: aminotransferase class V-fold PLP-dependent enzyme [Chloroflexota bacterium]|nr:aminotransferase class V-fold PLP-dependent enzyme [Chloroflexota bacterium]
MTETTTRPTTLHTRLGVRPIINAAGTLTKFGGSIMPREVREAMLDAGSTFVDLVELQHAVGARIAELTHNEAAYVSCGAAAGLTLVTAALITGPDEAKAERLPLPDGPMYDVLIHRSQRFGYDHAIRMVGVNLVEFGVGNGAQEWELEAAYSDRTIAVVFLAGALNEQRALPIETVIASAHRHNVPVIVDAAAQIPPIENLWRYTRDLGADIAIFSGGKALRGPQPSGLVLGRKAIIENIYVNASPNANIGRPMKVGKEELGGILAAVEWSLRQDEKALLERYEAVVQFFIDRFDGKKPGLSVRRDFPSEAGQPHPRALFTFDEKVLGLATDKIVQALQDGEPSIVVASRRRSMYLNPQTLEDGEEKIIARRLAEVLGIG